jgi:hypothetical protein
MKALHRADRKGEDPQTPDVRTKCSKRCFDGLLRSWRRRLHRYDPPDGTGGTSGQQAGMDDALTDAKYENEDKDFPCTPIKRSHMSINVGSREVSRGSDHANDKNAETVRF